MTAWIVYIGKSKKELGRVLGRDKKDALKRAELCWGRGKKYRLEEVTR